MAFSRPLGKPAQAALLGVLLSVGEAAPPQGTRETSPRRDVAVKSAVSVTAIDLDASATSKDGNPVGDLRADEVVLKIDGKPVTLDYFTPVETGRLAGPAFPSAHVPGVPRRPGAGADASGLVARHFLLIIDEDHLIPTDRLPVFEAARTLLAELEPSDRLAAAVLQQGRLRPLVAFGATAQEAGKALAKQEKELTLGALRFGILRSSSYDLTMDRGNEMNSFGLLERAVRAFGSYPGRKEMVVISRGVNRYEASPGHSLNREFEQVVSQANRSRVTIHTLGAARLAGGDTALC